MPTKFLASNYISSASMLAASSQSAVNLGNVWPENAGSAVLQRFGTYTDTVDRNYVILIEDVPGDGSYATFRWSDTGGIATPANPTGWNATGIGTIQLGDQIGPFAMSHGLSFNFYPLGALPYFVIGDFFKFPVRRPNSAGNLIVLNRDKWYQSAATPDTTVVTVAVDLGSARQPLANAIYDHNLVSSTVIRLQGDDASSFSSLNHNEVLTWGAQQIKSFTAMPSLRYWRLHMTVSGSTQASIRIGNWYLGDMVTMSKSFNIGFPGGALYLGDDDPSILIRGTAPLGFTPRHWDLTFGHVREGASYDLAKLLTLWDITHDQARRTMYPFFFYQDEGFEVPLLAMVQWRGERPVAHQFLNRYHADLQLIELITTRAA